MSTKLNGKNAPDFALTDIQGRIVRLSDHRDRRNIVLVFNRSVY